MQMISEKLRATGPFSFVRLLVDIEGRPCRQEDAMAVRYEVQDAQGNVICNCLDEETAVTVAAALSAYAPLNP
ncbi:hypothetical protein [Rhizobium halophytocola]|uniref:Uncharacterized protein n=1 Tax=Rhizobium halophytocola TaxID=735519 RepID=A0ABS4DVW4_9HYPH|nr:hypothetical protein [Rhizobium halophytocola]MBP1849839.1 hypothetical protein [Rhizobium halophytocola]